MQLPVVKHQLVWFPIVGQASQALEFPFMKRYTPDYLAKHPEKRGRDLETTRRACQRYRQIPVAILNFVEGTRFTLEKHADQESPYRHLLRPRIGGISFVLASLGDQLDGFFDVTLGVTYKPLRSVIIRPELRVDWSPDARPYNDQTSKVQFVPAIDVIVRF